MVLVIFKYIVFYFFKYSKYKHATRRRVGKTHTYTCLIILYINTQHMRTYLKLCEYENINHTNKNVH